MRSVILAAGTGTRLGGTNTKALVEVNGRKMIDYLFDFIDVSTFEEVLVVGGFHYGELQDYIDSLGYQNVRVLENPDYLKGNIFTLMRALKEFNSGSFLITNVDHIYPRVMFEKMKKSFSGITAMCDFDRNLGLDDMKVLLREDDTHIEAIDKKLTNYNCGYIGMTYVDGAMNDVYRSAADETVNKVGEKAVVENILQTLAANPETAPKICDLSGFGWYEVDDATDLARAEKGLLTDKNFTR